MRISDWSSDVCSSDLEQGQRARGLIGRGKAAVFVPAGRCADRGGQVFGAPGQAEQAVLHFAVAAEREDGGGRLGRDGQDGGQRRIARGFAAQYSFELQEIGRSSCRERVGLDV